MRILRLTMDAVGPFPGHEVIDLMAALATPAASYSLALPGRVNQLLLMQLCLLFMARFLAVGILPIAGSVHAMPVSRLKLRWS